MNSSERSLLDGRGMRRTSIVFAIVLACGASTVRAQQQNDQQQPPARTSPPFPNRANEVLPSWLRVRGEFRERFEGFAHSGFTPERDDSYWLSRLRLNATVTPSRLLSATGAGCRMRASRRKQVGPTTPPFRGPFDLRMAYADIGDVQKARRLGPRRPAGARLRRAAADRPPQLDEHRAHLRRRAGHDSARRVSGRRVRRIGRAHRRRRSSTRAATATGFFGAYGSLSTLVPKRSVEPYVFWRADRDLRTESATTGDLNPTTDRRALRREAAGAARLRRSRWPAQTGSLGSDSIGAWAGHWQLRESLAGSLDRPADRRVQLRLRRRRSRPTARAAPSISSIRPATTSTASPIRSAGATSATLRAGVELTPVRRLAGHRQLSLVVARRIDTTRSTTPAARRSRASPAAPPRRTSARRSTSRLTRALTPQLQRRRRLRAHRSRARFSRRPRPAPSTATRTSWSPTCSWRTSNG